MIRFGANVCGPVEPEEVQRQRRRRRRHSADDDVKTDDVSKQRKLNNSFTYQDLRLDLASEKRDRDDDDDHRLVGLLTRQLDERDRRILELEKELDLHRTVTGAELEKKILELNREMNSLKTDMMQKGEEVERMKTELVDLYSMNAMSAEEHRESLMQMEEKCISTAELNSAIESALSLKDLELDEKNRHIRNLEAVIGRLEVRVQELECDLRTRRSECIDQEMQEPRESWEDMIQSLDHLRTKCEQKSGKKIGVEDEKEEDSAVGGEEDPTQPASSN